MNECKIEIPLKRYLFKNIEGYSLGICLFLTQYTYIIVNS